MGKVLKENSESRGLRMRVGLWAAMDKLAELDKRKTSQYIILALEEIADKNKLKLKK